MKVKKINFERLLKEYKDIFQEELPDRLPPKHSVDHAIETGNTCPVNKNAYPLSVEQLKEQTRQIDDLLKRGLIRKSVFSWGASVLFVPKKTDEWRMCHIDYRILNSKTLRNAYSLLRIIEYIDKLGEASHMSSIDLLSSYWQLRVAEKDVSKTAFNTKYGKYEFLVITYAI